MVLLVVQRNSILLAAVLFISLTANVQSSLFYAMGQPQYSDLSELPTLGLMALDLLILTAYVIFGLSAVKLLRETTLFQ